MAGKKPDFRLMTSREKRNGDGNIYTTIGAAWLVDKGAISIQFEALPMSRNAVLFPVTDDDDEKTGGTPVDCDSDIPF